MADCSGLLQQGLGLVQAAAKCDAENNLPEALRLYSLALEAFVSVLRMERNPRIVNTLKGKVEDYMKRAEEIKGILGYKTGVPSGDGGVAARPSQVATDPSSLNLPSPPVDLPARGQPMAVSQSSFSPIASQQPGGTPGSQITPTSSAPYSSPYGLSNPPAPSSPYLSPAIQPPTSSVATPPEVGIINIEEGQLGKNFEAIFAAYIAGSQEIWIKDPNLVHTHQIYNLIRFCELVVRINRKVTLPCTKINVITAFENDIQLSTLQSALAELADSLREHGVTLLATFDNQGEKEAIFSSGWTLILPNGLDIHQSPIGRFRLGACDLMLRPAKQNIIKVIRTEVFHS